MNSESAICNPQSAILLTGATSGTGRRLVARLLERGRSLRCFLHDPDRRALLPDDPRVEIVMGSLRDDEDVLSALDGVETVVNLAHIRFAPRLIDLMNETGREYRFVSVSSTRLFSQFVTTVREEVREAEEYICHAPPSIRWTILRPSMIFGGGEDNNVARVARFLRRSRFFPVFGRGENLVQPTFVLDLVGAIENSLESARAEQRCFTLAGSEPMTYCDMVRAVARAAGLPSPIFVRVPLKPSLLLAQILSLVWKGAPVEMIRRFGEDRAFVTTPAQRDLDFHATPFDEALARKFKGDV